MISGNSRTPRREREITSERSFEWLRRAAAEFEELSVEHGLGGIARVLDVRDSCRVAQKGSAGYADGSQTLFDALRNEERRRRLYAELVPSLVDVLTAAIAAERATGSTAANLYNRGAVLRDIQRSCLVFLGNVGPNVVFESLGAERFRDLASSIAKLFEADGERRTAAHGLYVLARFSFQFPELVFDDVPPERVVSFIQEVVRGDEGSLDMTLRFEETEWNFAESSSFMLLALRAFSERSVPDVDVLFSPVESGEGQLELLSALLSAEWNEGERGTDVIERLEEGMEGGGPGSAAVFAYQALVSQTANPEYASRLLDETLLQNETDIREEFQAVEWLVVEGSLENYEELVSLAIDGLRELGSANQTDEVGSYYCRLIFVCLFRGEVPRSTIRELQQLLSDLTTTVYYDPSTKRKRTLSSPHDVGPVDLLALLNSTSDIERDRIRSDVESLTLDLLSEPTAKRAVLTRLLQYQKNGLLSETAERRVSNAVLAEFDTLLEEYEVSIPRAVGYQMLSYSLLLPVPERYKVRLVNQIQRMAVSDMHESLTEGASGIGQYEDSELEFVSGLIEDAAEFELFSRSQASLAIELSTEVLAEAPGAIRHLHEPLKSIFENYSIGRAVSTETFEQIARLENGLAHHTRLLLYAISANGRVESETFLGAYRQLLRLDTFDPMLMDRGVSEYDMTRTQLKRGVTFALRKMEPTTHSHELLTASVFLSKAEDAHAGLVSHRSFELSELSLDLTHPREVKALQHLARAGLASRTDIIEEVVRTVNAGLWNSSPASSAETFEGDYDRLTKAIEESAHAESPPESEISDIERVISTYSLPPELRLQFIDGLIEGETTRHDHPSFGAT